MKERAEYRLRYPLLARPAIRLRHGGYELSARVEDLSESGALCTVHPDHGITPGDRLWGRIDLVQRRVFEFAGHCLRVRGDEIAVVFDRDCRVPLPVIFEEQRSVRARFPEWR